MKKCLDDVTGRVPFAIDGSETTSSTSEPSSQQSSSTNLYQAQPIQHQGSQKNKLKQTTSSNNSSRQISLNSLNSNMDRIQINDRNYTRI